MKKITCLILPALFLSRLVAQTITPQVINAAGRDHGQIGTSGMYYTDNVGEPFTQTKGPLLNMMITEGFLQPKSGKTYNFNKLVSPTSCKDKNDGSLKIEFSSVYPTFTVSYQLIGAQTNSTSGSDLFTDLAAGIYTLQMNYDYSNIKTTITDTVRIGKTESECFVIFTGFTPNGDGVNDQWVIRNITDYPKNRVSIYNRWGIQIFDVEGYDNTTKIWPPADMLDKITASTYFYIIDLGNGSTPIKGWVEVIKN